MIIPLEISFRDMRPSDAIEEYVRSKASKLDRYVSDITRCRVMVEAPHRHQRKGRPYHVRIDIRVPHDELVVNRQQGALVQQDVHACIDEAFDDAQRLLQDYARRRRHDVKQHDATTSGRVIRLFAEEGYGFLETQEGEQVYFHKNAVMNGAFDRLEVGARVRFSAEDGREGPQATTVEWSRNP